MTTSKTFGGHRYLRRAKRAPVAKASRRESLNRLERLVGRRERKIAEAFMESVRGIRELATLEEIVRRLEAGQSVETLFTDATLRNQLRPLGTAITASAIAGAQITAELQATGAAVRGVDGTMVNFTFNATNPRLSSFAEEVSAHRVREVSEDVRAVIREVVRRESVAGVNPLQAARTIRESIGLTARQEQAVANFRQMLEDGDRAALRRALRDKRFDATVARAIRGDRALSAEQIDRMVDRYRERFVKYRSEVIGRTEATRSINGASREYLQEFIDDGTIMEEQVRRFWHTARDERVRSLHRQIPGMNERGVGMREPFQTPLGPLEYPGDPSGLPENTIQCRCTVFQRVVSQELLEDGVTA